MKKPLGGGWCVMLCTAVLIAGSESGRAEVLSLTLGIDTNCPYGLGE